MSSPNEPRIPAHKRTGSCQTKNARLSIVELVMARLLDFRPQQRC